MTALTAEDRKSREREFRFGAGGRQPLIPVVASGFEEEGEEVGEVLVAESGFDAGGHEGSGRAADAGDFAAGEAAFGSAGEAQRDAGGVVAEEDARFFRAMGGLDGGGGELSGDFAVGVEDGDEQGGGTFSAEGGAVRAYGEAIVAVAVAGGAAIEEVAAAVIRVAGEGEGGLAAGDFRGAVGWRRREKVVCAAGRGRVAAELGGEGGGDFLTGQVARDEGVEER
jgi:hypothetical protein